MLTYGGLGIFLAGLFFMLGGTKFVKDADKAAKARQQAPLLMLVGAAMFGLAIVLSWAASP
ncbi:hypothetical protein [Aurantiacibacter gangjinensis]|uniref:Uncharacterized protein n=1 Tax=Aurantiacibacter gangjinensis TaxID=502682 RepID=A0A0G9MKY0_9SPHN|nr:hypothetical protein [Aurantiacibacter gangjinensis]APE27221.1 hypothetical protein BMF35_a0392 [Aurantiacibacter gangjinensis]KLE31345.1 hypothetical protein AAW01_06970 [Aurantiacibacter gangjinensis]